MRHSELLATPKRKPGNDSYVNDKVMIFIMPTQLAEKMGTVAVILRQHPFECVEIRKRLKEIASPEAPHRSAPQPRAVWRLLLLCQQSVARSGRRSSRRELGRPTGPRTGIGRGSWTCRPQPWVGCCNALSVNMLMRYGSKARNPRMSGVFPKWWLARGGSLAQAGRRNSGERIHQTRSRFSSRHGPTWRNWQTR